MSNTKNLVTKHFNKLSETYDKKSLNRKKYLDSIDEIIIKYVKAFSKNNKKKNIKMLDVGCGTGTRSKKIEGRIPDCTVYGCDQSPEMISIAKHKIKNTRIQDMSKLKYADKSFDVIMCLFNTFGYLENKRKRIEALNHFKRVLKKDGLLFIDVMNFWHFGEGIKFKRTLPIALRELLLSYISPKIGPKNKYFSLKIDGKNVEGFVHGFTNSEMKKLFRKTGFRIEKQIVIGYDTGKIRKKITAGQLFYICRPL